MAAKLEPTLETAVRAIHDFDSFREFLRAELRWPVPADRELAIEDLTYEFLAGELQLKPEQSDRVKVRQLIPLEPGQPWGVFLLEFNAPRFYRTWVRQIMRALAPRRRRDPRVPAWHHENLLFICTHDYRQFTFGHFTGDKPTGARLTTFGLDPDVPKWRTLCEFNLPALRWPAEDGQPPKPDAWLKQWKQAFDKEALTNRFFKIFREQFTELAKDISTNNPGLLPEEVNTEAQIILERLLFRYFLQRKGWLNQQRDYLFRHFQEIYQKNPGGTSYFSKFLMLAFQQLSAQSDRFVETVGCLPFLNGGLFEDDPLVYSRETQRRLNPKVSNAAFREIFENLLEPFNFTVREDTPLNQDVAVDPEMLGKILESLVLEMEEAGDAYAPDRRKATGSYYTPRIVVHFICREVLRQYLMARIEGPNWRERLAKLLNIDATDGIDEAEFQTLRENLTQGEAERIRALLAEIKACDPAVGSGAFAVGLLHELVNLWTLCEARERNKDPREDRNYLFQVKRRFIENSIYGVDVLERAVEICKLRLWLSLIVDYELPVDPFECTSQQFGAALRKLPPLPNLAFKIRRGDSLLDQLQGHEILLEQFVRREGKGSGEGQRLVDEVVKLKTQFFEERDLQTKRRLQIEILQKQWELAERFIQQQIEGLPAAQMQGFFGETEKEAEKRRWREEQEQRLREALGEIKQLRKRVENIDARKTISDLAARTLAELEGQVGKDISFVWHLDFAEVFNRKPQTVATLGGEFAFMELGPGQMELPEKRPTPSGFDIIVGNPPFVTARNPELREKYRKRWPRVCRELYHLLAPFFERAFTVLTRGGELGFIVSNAFAKRDFGKGLVEGFLPTVNLRKVVDCSGLLFPGHGTPTCIVFGSNESPQVGSTIRDVATLPGGGDLLTPPEESALWHSIAAHHSAPWTVEEGTPLQGNDQSRGFRKVYEDFRIAVGDCDRHRLLRHPVRLTFPEWPVSALLENSGNSSLTEFLARHMGFNFMTHQDDVFKQPLHVVRRIDATWPQLRRCFPGNVVRNWTLVDEEWILAPYTEKWELLQEKSTSLFAYLRKFRVGLEGRAVFDGGTYKDARRPWYEYHQIDLVKSTAPLILVCPEIATHVHCLVGDNHPAWPQTVQVARLHRDTIEDHHLIAGLLNTAAPLFWLKQVCFNKGAGEDEERDRFVFAGGKVEQLPVPQGIADALRGRSDTSSEKLAELSRSCWQRGQQMPSPTLKKLFEKVGEAYHDWNGSLPGYVAAHPDLFGVQRPPLQRGFESAGELRDVFKRAQEIRECLRAEMIALQEEMDWLVYAAYGLLPEDHPAVAPVSSPTNPSPPSPLPEGEGGPAEAGAGGGNVFPLDRDQRPFRLWAQAEGDYARAVAALYERRPDSPGTDRGASPTAAWPHGRSKLQ